MTSRLAKANLIMTLPPCLLPPLYLDGGFYSMAECELLTRTLLLLLHNMNHMNSKEFQNTTMVCVPIYFPALPL
jgi:hypothetical protein